MPVLRPHEPQPPQPPRPSHNLPTSPTAPLARPHVEHPYNSGEDNTLAPPGETNTIPRTEPIGYRLGVLSVPRAALEPTLSQPKAESEPPAAPEAETPRPGEHTTIPAAPHPIAQTRVTDREADPFINPTTTAEKLRQVVEEALPAIGPEITFYGTFEPRTLQVDPERYRAAIPDRLEVERAITKTYRNMPNDVTGWDFCKGEYTAWADLDRSMPRSDRPLVPDELAMTSDIDKLLENKTTDTPVVALDFGGGMGLSWMRIASEPKYKEAIEGGRLVLAVSNLGATPDPTPDAEGYSGVAKVMNAARHDPDLIRYSLADMDWAQDSQGLIRYVDANGLELADMSISQADGTSVPLRGNVGLIHEKFALMHTHVPDMVLAGFNELLGEQGVLYSDAASYYHMMHPPQFDEVTVEDGRVVPIDIDYRDQRNLALGVGSKMLRQQGFSYVTDERLMRGVFRRLPRRG